MTRHCPTETLVLGDHSDTARRLARGIRLSSRPYVTRWGDDYWDPSIALTLSADVIARHLPTIDVITWVPGHDGTPGPGFHLAEAISRAIDAPLEELLTRPTPIRSAHRSLLRPTRLEVERSLAASEPSRRISGRVLLVDNVVASGASMTGSANLLRELDLDVMAAAVSIDLALSRSLVAASRPLWTPSRPPSDRLRPSWLCLEAPRAAPEIAA